MAWSRDKFETDSHLKCGLVDCNLHKVVVGMLGWNGPNTDKRCTGSTCTNVMDVLGPSHGNGGIGILGSSPDNDRDCGKESTEWKEWQGQVDRHGVVFGLERP